jgi:hypothetical protein
MRDYKIWAAFAVAAAAFYFVALFDSQTSVQGDAVDVHYSAQKYFADSVREGHLPHWTPYVFSGFPFLADPRTGAWYPVHWPFFLLGITPRAIEWELALHAFLALCGTYLLARRLTGDHMPALIAAMFYAGGGFFAAHSAHVGMFEIAALLPWLLWSGLRALEDSRGLLTTGVIGGAILLIGEFQTALYCFLALALLVAARRPALKRGVTVIAVAGVVAILLSAVQILPALELMGQSSRTAVHTPLKLGALATLAMPNFYGAASGNYSGPFDATQFYFYAGILLVPMAMVGLIKSRSAVPLVQTASALAFASYSVDVWFVVALGLALAAASGAAWLADRFQKPWLMIAVLLFSIPDLWFFNMGDNALAYASTLRTGADLFAEKYGDPYTNFQNHLAAAKLRPFTRIWSAFDTNSFGPLNSSLEGRTEVTYGYNPLELARYREYLAAADQNPKLLNGLAVTFGIDTQRGVIVENSNALPRISAPPQVKFVASHAAARALLAGLDPAQWAIVETALRPLAPGATRVEIVNYTGDSYRAKYTAAFDCLLRIAVPYYPGWAAAIDGKSAPVYAVDDALSGVFAPAGTHELTFRYRSNWFVAGAAISTLAILGIILSSIFLRRSR